METYWEKKFGSQKIFFHHFRTASEKCSAFRFFVFDRMSKLHPYSVLVGKIERNVVEKIRFFHQFRWMSENFTDFCWFFSSKLTKLHSTCPLNPFQAKWNVCKRWKFSSFFCKRAKDCWSLVENFPMELSNVQYTCPWGHPVEKVF